MLIRHGNMTTTLAVVLFAVAELETVAAHRQLNLRHYRSSTDIIRPGSILMTKTTDATARRKPLTGKGKQKSDQRMVGNS